MAVLTCNNLTKYFDHALALDHVNLEIQPGRIVGLLGPNGSGKPPLIKLANGLLTPSSGELRIDGQLPSPATRELVSYLPERPYLADWMTVSQLLDFFCDFYANFDRGAAEKMLMALQISPKLRIKQMSKGTREKVQLILVMSRRDAGLHHPHDPHELRRKRVHRHLHAPDRGCGEHSGRRHFYQKRRHHAPVQRRRDPSGARLQRG